MSNPADDRDFRSPNPADDEDFIGDILDQDLNSAPNANYYLSSKDFIFIKNLPLDELTIADVEVGIPIIEKWSNKYKKLFPLIIDGTETVNVPKKVVDFCLHNERFCKSHSAIIFLDRGHHQLNCKAINSFVVLKEMFGGYKANPARMTQEPGTALAYLDFFMEGGRKIDSLSKKELELLRLEFFRFRSLKKTAAFYGAKRDTVRAWINAIYEKLGTGYLYKIGTMIRMSSKRDFFDDFDEPKTKDFDIGKYLSGGQSAPVRPAPSEAEPPNEEKSNEA